MQLLSPLPPSPLFPSSLSLLLCSSHGVPVREHGGGGTGGRGCAFVCVRECVFLRVRVRVRCAHVRVGARARACECVRARVRVVCVRVRVCASSRLCVREHE
jgi:hypothetical protein